MSREAPDRHKQSLSIHIRYERSTRATHATPRCKPIHSSACHNHLQQSSACSRTDSRRCEHHCTSAACESGTRPCRVVSEHAMRARTSTDPQANLQYRVTAASAMSASLCSLSNIAVGVW